jgi:hypothetical protein
MARAYRTDVTISVLLLGPLALQRILGERMTDQQPGKDIGSPAKISTVIMVPTPNRGHPQPRPEEK